LWPIFSPLTSWFIEFIHSSISSFSPPLFCPLDQSLFMFCFFSHSLCVPLKRTFKGSMFI
jgi:hypothetical protein